MKKSISVILTLVLLLMSLCACGGEEMELNDQTSESSSVGQNQEKTPPVYIGEWISKEVRLTITENNIAYTIADCTYESSYTVSEDSNYTYLSCNLQGSQVVFVLINKDMIGFCLPSDGSTPSITIPGGVRLAVEVKVWLFRDGAYTTEIPTQWAESIQSKIGDSSPVYYYKEVGVFYIPNYWGFPMIAVTADNQLSGAENIALVGLSADEYGSTAIRAKGNFIITDNK